MSVEFYRGSPGKLDSRTLSRKTLSRWTGRTSPSITVNFQTKNLQIWSLGQANSKTKEVGFLSAPSNFLAQ